MYSRRHYWQYLKCYNVRYWNYRNITSKCSIKEVRRCIWQIFIQEHLQTTSIKNKNSCRIHQQVKQIIWISWQYRTWNMLMLSNLRELLSNDLYRYKNSQSTASPESDDFSWMARHEEWKTPMYQSIPAIQRQTDSSQWGYLPRKLSSFQKYFTTRNANNISESSLSRSLFT